MATNVKVHYRHLLYLLIPYVIIAIKIVEHFLFPYSVHRWLATNTKMNPLPLLFGLLAGGNQRQGILPPATHYFINEAPSGIYTFLNSLTPRCITAIYYNPYYLMWLSWQFRNPTLTARNETQISYVTVKLVTQCSEHGAQDKGWFGICTPMGSYSFSLDLRLVPPPSGWGRFWSQMSGSSDDIRVEAEP